MSGFQWDRMYKWEENIDGIIFEGAEEYVKEFYGIENIDDLTPEQISEIEKFIDELGYESFMLRGLRDIIAYWDSENFQIPGP